jgi:hypothetical protein
MPRGTISGVGKTSVHGEFFHVEIVDAARETTPFSRRIWYAERIVGDSRAGSHRGPTSGRIAYPRRLLPGFGAALYATGNIKARRSSSSGSARRTPTGRQQLFLNDQESRRPREPIALVDRAGSKCSLRTGTYYPSDSPGWAGLQTARSYRTNPTSGLARGNIRNWSATNSKPDACSPRYS